MIKDIFDIKENIFVKMLGVCLFVFCYLFTFFLVGGIMAHQLLQIINPQSISVNINSSISNNWFSISTISISKTSLFQIIQFRISIDSMSKRVPLETI